MTEKSIPARIIIPKPRGEVVGAFVLTVFIMVFVALAISSLVQGIALIPSIIWLLIVLAVSIVTLKDEGIHEFLVNVLGSFSLSHFAEAVHLESNITHLQFGFRLFGHCFFYQRIPVVKIERVEWRPGQATNLAGRDMKDWQLALWFEHENSKQDVYIVGPSRPKEITASFAQEFLAFLERAGVILVQGEDDSAFIQEPASMEQNGEHSKA